jgi:hypothetical protein
MIPTCSLPRRRRRAPVRSRKRSGCDSAALDDVNINQLYKHPEFYIGDLILSFSAFVVQTQEGRRLKNYFPVFKTRQ